MMLDPTKYAISVILQLMNPALPFGLVLDQRDQLGLYPVMTGERPSVPAWLSFGILGPYEKHVVAACDSTMTSV